MKLRFAALPLALVGGLGATSHQLLAVNLRRSRAFSLELPQVCFFTLADSVVAGDDLDLHIHCPAGGELSIARLGKDSAPEEPVLTTTVDRTIQSAHYDLWTGLDWSSTNIATGTGWRPGLYLLELRSGSARYRQVLIISGVRPSRVGVVLSTNTRAAYNDFGGLSNYHDQAMPVPLRYLYRLARVTNQSTVVGDRRYIPSVPLPHARPNDAVDRDLTDLAADPITDFSHLVRSEWSLLRYLDRLDIDYNVFAEHDLAFGVGPTDSELLIFAAHSEYWSEEMLGRFTSFIASGGHALFMSGNNCYRMVKHLEHGLEVVTQKVDAHLTADLLGTGYTADGYESSAPFRVVRPDHPVFDGLNLAAGDLFGGPDQFGNGASGHETDKVNSASGKVEVLAVGTNAEGPAFMSWKDHPDGGWVCNLSSVRAAPWAERCDVFGRIIKNVIALGVD